MSSKSNGIRGQTRYIVTKRPSANHRTILMGLNIPFLLLYSRRTKKRVYKVKNPLVNRRDFEWRSRHFPIINIMIKNVLLSHIFSLVYSLYFRPGRVERIINRNNPRLVLPHTEVTFRIFTTRTFLLLFENLERVYILILKLT